MAFQYKVFTIFLLVFSLILQVSLMYVNKGHVKASKYRYYPKNTVFKKSDLIDKGCVVFLNYCPKAYKRDLICARHYDGKYKTFNTYCDMEYENCNGWRQWSMIKRTRC